MNVFKFVIDLSRKKTEKSIVLDLKEIYANELEKPEDVDKYLNEKQIKSGQNFKDLFSENMPIAFGARSSGQTKYFVSLMDSYPKKYHDRVCIYVKTDDENIFKQFKWVCDDLKKHCKTKSIEVNNKGVSELYIFLCEIDDVKYPESSIKANVGPKNLDVFSILCLIIELGIAIFIAFTLYYNYVNWFSAISIWVAVGIPFIMEIKDWKSRKLIIENLSQNVKSEPNGNDGNSSSPTKKRQNGNSKLKAPPTGTQQGLASASSVPAQASLAQGNTASVTPPPTPSAQENTAPSANH